jgi:uncharacterized protein (DUF885 family)
MQNKKILSRILALILICAFAVTLLSGCRSVLDLLNNDDGSDAETDESIVAVEEDFDLLMDEIFADWVSNDALTMNYFLADPYSPGIERPESTFGEVVTLESIEKARQETLDLSDRLDRFEYTSLRDDQKVVYEILRRLIELSRILEREDDFSYYTGYIRPLNGIQVQMPVLLAEFNFYTADDIERYIDLLWDMHRYFSDIIEFERERSQRGFFLNEDNTDNVIEQIESFVENREDNLLITVFNYKIDGFSGLGNEQKEQYKARNKEAVLNSVLRAYDDLLAAMKELRGIGTNPGGLAALPDGREYAHALLRLRIGTDKSARELERLLDSWMDTTWNTIMDLLHGEHQLIQRFINNDLGNIEADTPESYISTLQNHIAQDFPQIKETQLTILEVHESLQAHMSPAFYLAPAIDRFNENVVYINPSSVGDNLFLFTVLAHESYPGHMYQTVYFLQQSPHPIRVALSNTGYSEGWATYAEMTSYFFAGLDYEEATLLWNLRFFDLLLQSIADLGVNVNGWSYGDVADFLSEFGFSDDTIVRSIYNRAVGVPLMSLMYSLGYIEMIELHNEALSMLGHDFILLDFHRFILDFGSAPYPIIRERMINQLRSSETLAPAA